MDKKTPLVTVGIPAFNEQRFIKATILSVLNQTYENFELIITDDASTDNTVEIIKSINDNRIRLVEGKKNMGISYRLNQQIEMAHGKYFFRMDADDLMFFNRLEKQVGFLEENSSVDAVGGQAIVINDQNEIIGQRFSKQEFTSIDQLFLSNRFIHPTVAGKTAWFKKWKYRDNYAGCEDLDLWIRSYHDSKFADMLEPLIFYRDPLNFKLRTFLHRKYKGILCRISLRKYIISKALLFKIICRNSFVALASIFFFIIKKDYLLIKRRNQSVENREYYKKQLDYVLKK